MLLLDASYKLALTSAFFQTFSSVLQHFQLLETSCATRSFRFHPLPFDRFRHHAQAPRHSLSGIPRPPLLASWRTRKNQVRLQDMFGLTKARTSPRDQNEFPVAQLFLLGWCTITDMSVPSMLTHGSPRTSCRAHRPYFHLSLCHQARCPLWRVGSPGAFLCGRPDLCIFPRRGMHWHVLGGALRSDRPQASTLTLPRLQLLANSSRYFSWVVAVPYLPCSSSVFLPAFGLLSRAESLVASSTGTLE